MEHVAMAVMATLAGAALIWSVASLIRIYSKGDM